MNTSWVTLKMAAVLKIFSGSWLILEKYHRRMLFAKFYVCIQIWTISWVICSTTGLSTVEGGLGKPGLSRAEGGLGQLGLSRAEGRLGQPGLSRAEGGLSQPRLSRIEGGLG